MILTGLDITIIALLGLSTIHGFFKGFITISVKLASFLLAVILAFSVYPFASMLLAEYISSSFLATSLAGVVVVFSSYMLLSLASSKLLTIIGNIRGGAGDKLLGVIVGFLRGSAYLIAAFLLSIIIISGSYKEQDNTRDLVIASAKVDMSDWFGDSFLIPHLRRTSLIVATFLPFGYLDRYYSSYYHSEYQSNSDLDSSKVEDMFNRQFGDENG